MPTNDFAPNPLPLYHPAARKDLLQTVEQAMKDRAPKMHADLRKSGDLRRVLNLRANQIMESFEEANEAVRRDAQKANDGPGYDAMKHLQDLTMGKSQAWAVALENGLEFADEEADAPAREEMLAHIDRLEATDWNDPESVGRMFAEMAVRQGAEAPGEDGEEAPEE